MITTYIGVGTNIEREKHAQAAVDELSQLGCELKASTVYECEAIGFDANPFFNFVIELKTILSLTEFSHKLRTIELNWGRAENAKKYQDRTLDLDILLFGDIVSASAPALPRRDIFEYSFVTLPLYELCPQLIVPDDGRTIEKIWYTMSNGSTSLRPVSLSLVMER